jgi:hypothetical protein
LSRSDSSWHNRSSLYLFLLLYRLLGTDFTINKIYLGSKQQFGVALTSEYRLVLILKNSVINPMIASSVLKITLFPLITCISFDYRIFRFHRKRMIKKFFKVFILIKIDLDMRAPINIYSFLRSKKRMVKVVITISII